MPRVAVDVGYFRRSWANFASPTTWRWSADFTPFNITNPVDPRLGEDSGQVVTGFVDVVPGKFGQVQNYNTLSTKVGDQTEVWQGVDFTINARLRNGLNLQGGLSTGKTHEDDCDILTALRRCETCPRSPLPIFRVAASAAVCDRESPYLTQAKLFGVYVIPKVEVQLSGTFRSVPGQINTPPPENFVNVALVATNAFLATNSTLGRPLSGTAPNTTLQILAPHQHFLDRRNELDFRVGKLLRFSRHRMLVSLDIFNALNSDAIVNVNQSSNVAAGGGLASYLRPTEILNARVLKFTVTHDF